MTRIEECEKLFADWKAKAETSISYKLIESAKRQANTAHGIALALEIFKRPSNAQLKIDTPHIEHDEDCDSYNIGGECNCRAAWWRAT